MKAGQEQRKKSKSLKKKRKKDDDKHEEVKGRLQPLSHHWSHHNHWAFLPLHNHWGTLLHHNHWGTLSHPSHHNHRGTLLHLNHPASLWVLLTVIVVRSIPAPFSLVQPEPGVSLAPVQNILVAAASLLAQAGSFLLLLQGGVPLPPSPPLLGGEGGYGHTEQGAPAARGCTCSALGCHGQGGGQVRQVHLHRGVLCTYMLRMVVSSHVRLVWSVCLSDCRYECQVNVSKLPACLVHYSFYFHVLFFFLFHCSVTEVGWLAWLLGICFDKVVI